MLDEIRDVIEGFRSFSPAMWVIFGIGVLFILCVHYGMYRLTRRTVAKQASGWSNPAQKAKETRSVGFSGEEPLVLKVSAKQKLTLVFGFVFFGGGFLFLLGNWAEYVAQRDYRAIAGLVICGLFAALIPVLFVFVARKITFGEDSLTEKRLFRRKRSRRLSEIESVDWFQKNKPTSGFKLRFKDGAVIKVPSNLNGFKEFAVVVGRFNPHARAAVLMQKMGAKNA